MRPNAILEFALNRALEIIPSLGAREERLANVTRQAVVVGVEQLRRYIVAALMLHPHTRRIEHVYPIALAIAAAIEVVKMILSSRSSFHNRGCVRQSIRSAQVSVPLATPRRQRHS